MIGRLAFRSLTAHPVRSAVLAAGFGVGVSVMAILLGVAEIVLQQAQSPALIGGGDVLARLNQSVPARMVLAGTLQSDALRERVRAASPFHNTGVYLVRDGRTTRVSARGGIPSRERIVGDDETGTVEAWRDSTADLAWVSDAPDRVLRQIDRFHEIPDAPDWASSWAEWLYFNGRSGDSRFYLTFLVGPRNPDGRRSAGVRLQLERNGRMDTYSAGASLTDDEVRRAPDLTIGGSSVRLDGMEYRIHLDVRGANGATARGDLTLQASPGRLVPPLEVAGARGWITGYVVPVMSGRLGGTITVSAPGSADARVSLDDGTGYHDHNWGFWQGVSWQWGQVQQGDLSFLYGRVFPPREAADPERLPGFVGALGPDGPLGYATNVRITETNNPDGRPRTIEVTARGSVLELSLRFDVSSAEVTRMAQGPLANGVDFLQLRGTYTVRGQAAGRTIDFTAPGAAETFRGR
jgi:hypothetical protein